MRKTGIALTVIGAAAFAALLAWGFAFNTAQADETATPTATPAATGTPAPQPCLPVPVGTLSGAVTIDGVPAPAGTIIRVTKGGEIFGEETTTLVGQYAVNVLTKRITDVYPPCYTDILEALTITCDSATATQHPTSVPSGISTLDLTCTGGAVATATPSPTVTTTVTVTTTATPAVTATPAKPPVTGGGPGGGDGFAWWPLALAAAALTAVAGLYTARRATR
jgi:hypothetical protein